MVKLTFTFDQETVDRLREAAARLARPQSYVVREAVREYAERIGNLSEQERRHLLKVFDAVIPTIDRGRSHKSGRRSPKCGALGVEADAGITPRPGDSPRHVGPHRCPDRAKALRTPAPILD